MEVGELTFGETGEALQGQRDWLNWAKNLQVWFADLRAATEFAEAFDMRLKHHQNQEKQQRTVKQLLAMNI